MEVRQADRPEVLHVEFSDLRAALRGGWRDFIKAPHYGLFFANFYVLGGWLIWWSVTAKGQIWWTLPASAGFPILGPFIACGFYEISRRREAGEVLVLNDILLMVFRQKDRQIPSMAAVIVVFFLFWNFLSHMIFALFLGKATLTNITTSVEVFLTPEGIEMAFGAGQLDGTPTVTVTAIEEAALEVAVPPAFTFLQAATLEIAGGNLSGPIQMGAKVDASVAAPGDQVLFFVLDDFTEITGGEVQNIYRIRGLPNDGGFVSFQQDGLPLFDTEPQPAQPLGERGLVPRGVQ